MMIKLTLRNGRAGGEDGEQGVGQNMCMINVLLSRILNRSEVKSSLWSSVIVVVRVFVFDVIYQKLVYEQAEGLGGTPNERIKNTESHYLEGLPKPAPQHNINKYPS